MTTVQLFHRIGRRARGGDFTKLSMTEQTDIAEAANTAIEEVYNALPAYFKELTEGFLLPAPLSLAISVTQFSAVVPAATFTQEQIGRSVVIDGDPGWNQVLGTDQLLNPFIGPTGTANAIVYGDAVYSQRFPFDRIIGNPMFTAPSDGFMMRREMSTASQAQSLWPWEHTVGAPRAWWTQVLGKSQGNDPFWVLRFAPAPSITYSINVRINYWPKRLTLADYDSATTIPIPDQFLETSLIPLALRAFMSSPAWLTKNDDAAVEARGERGLAFAKNQLGSPSAPNNRIYTPLGY